MDAVRFPLIGWLTVLLLMAGPWPVPIARGAAPEQTPATAEGEEEEEAAEVPEENDSSAESVLFRTNRTSRLGLLKARQLVEEGRFSEAVRYLGTILEAREDCFFQPDESASIHRSLKAEAQRLIGEMPAKGREAYELQYGAHARALLSAAVASGSVEELAQVSRAFFHTQAGHEATMLLGLHHFDHGSPLAAALTLRRLRQTCPRADAFEPALSLTLATCWNEVGMADEARRVLADMKARLGTERVTIGGRDVPLFSSADESLEWLIAQVGPRPIPGDQQPEQWTLYRGSPTRNVLASASPPLLSLRWRVPITDDPGMESLLSQSQQALVDQDAAIVPRLFPLVVDNVVLMRTCSNLLAVDLDTAKRLWEVPVDNPVRGEMVVEGLNPVVQRSNQLSMALRQRVWEDATFGTLSSDGRLVFAVEDLGFQSEAIAFRQVVIAGRRQASPLESRPSNRLAAYDIRTGKLQWHIGGPKEEHALRQAETFFLGPPLPLMDQLYVLGEVESEIRLMALTAQTGDLVWSQPLAMVEQSIQLDPFRRFAGLSPSYSDGVLVCPTASGAVVGIELASRLLLWGYQYGKSDESATQPQIVAMRMGVLGMEGVQRWLDSSATIVDGRVIATPVESNELHCLDLLDGKLLWKAERQNDLYLAGVWNGRAILVGAQQIRALNLADGTPAWDGETIPLPQRAHPSGRGVMSGQTLLQPLTTAEVAVVDLAEGKIERLCRARDGSIPGNLIACRGRILSQGAEGLQSYYQIGYLRDMVDKRLAVQGDDAEMLALRGEIRLDEGDRLKAVEDFRQAYALSADARARQLLRESLLEGLRTDFAAYASHAAELETLLDDDSQRAVYERLMATGLQASGAWQAAFERYQRLVAIPDDYHRLESIDEQHRVRRDRWVQGQLAALREQAPAEVAAAMDGYVAARLDAALKAPSPDALRKFLDFFGHYPLSREARAQLSDRFARSGHLLQAEMLLWREHLSTDPAQAGQAVAALAALLRSAGRVQDAVWYDRELAGRLADVVCRDGKTGRQIAAEWSAKEQPATIAKEGDWPVGQVDVKREASQRQRTPGYGRFVLPYEGGSGPFFRDMAIEYDQNTRTVAGRDGWGNRQWEVSLAEQAQGSSMPFNRNFTFVKGLGHLLLLTMDYQLLALDTLGSQGGKPRLLWMQDLSEPAGDDGSQVIVRAVPWGANRIAFGSRFGNVSTAIGPVTERAVCFLRFRRCVAVDPLTGETLWIRENIAPGSSIYGDERFTFIVPPDSTEAIVLRTDDGTLCTEPSGDREPSGPAQQPAHADASQVDSGEQPPALLPPHATRAVPPDAYRLASDGRDLITREPADNSCRVRRYDPWEQQTEWEISGLDPHVLTVTVGDESVALLESTGRFRLIGISDGQARIDVMLPPEEDLVAMHALRLGNVHVLVLDRRPLPTAQPKPTQQVPGYTPEPVMNALVYAFNAEGKLAWPKPVRVENQHLLLNQPGLLPVVTFACGVHERSTEGQTQPKTVVFSIDKRTGRVVLNETLGAITSVFEIVGEPEKHLVELRLQQHTFSLRFTSEPLRPEQETPPPAEEVSTAEALLKAARRAVESLQSDPKAAGENAPDAAPPPEKE